MAQLAKLANCVFQLLLVGAGSAWGASRHCSDTATLQQWAACTHYEILGVELRASTAKIRRAYRGRALRWHPDKNPTGDADAASRFIRVVDAYDTLIDTDRRRAYDDGLRQHGAGAGSTREHEPESADMHARRHHRWQEEAMYWRNTWSMGQDVVQVHADNVEQYATAEARGGDEAVVLMLVYRVRSLDEYVTSGIIAAAVAGARELFGAVRLAAVDCGEEPAVDETFGVAAGACGGTAVHIRILHPGGMEEVGMMAYMKTSIQQRLLEVMHKHAPAAAQRLERLRTQLQRARERDAQVQAQEQLLHSDIAHETDVASGTRETGDFAIDSVPAPVSEGDTNGDVLSDAAAAGTRQKPLTQR